MMRRSRIGVAPDIVQTILRYENGVLITASEYETMGMCKEKYSREIFYLPTSQGGGKIFKASNGQWRRTVLKDGDGGPDPLKVEEVLLAGPVSPPGEENILHVFLYGDYEAGPFSPHFPDVVEEIMGRPLIPVVHAATKNVRRSDYDQFFGAERTSAEIIRGTFFNEVHVWSTYSWGGGAKTIPDRDSQGKIDFFLSWPTKSCCRVYRVLEGGRLEEVFPALFWAY
jgi:hypothetical protein